MPYANQEESVFLHQHHLHRLEDVFAAIRERNLEKLADLVTEKNINVLSVDQLYSPLHLACYLQHIPTITLLLKKGAYVNISNGMQETPLFIAAALGNLEILTLLIKNGATIDHTNLLQSTAFCKAVYYGHRPIIQYLLAEGANINQTTYFGETPYSIAEANLHKDALSLLKHKGATKPALTKRLGIFKPKETYFTYLSLWEAFAVNDYRYLSKAFENDYTFDLNARDSQGRNYLSWAVLNKYDDLIDWLLERKVNINNQDLCGQTALHLSVSLGYSTITLKLLEKGIDPNLSDIQGYTALHIAAYKNKKELFTLLNKHGARLDCQDKQGLAPLHIVAQKGYHEAITLLNILGTPVNQQSDDGSTALHIAIAVKHLKAAEALITCKADISVFNKKRQTPTELAAKEFDLEMLELLLANRGQSCIMIPQSFVDAVNKIQLADGHTLMTYAAKNNLVNVVKCLLDYNANINIRNKAGSTPLLLAAEHNHQQIIDLLLKEPKQTPDRNAADAKLYTALHYAALNSNYSLVERLLSNVTNILLNTRVIWAANHLEIVAQSPKRNSINDRALDGITPLHIAVQKRDDKIICALLNAGADPHAKDKKGNLALPAHKANLLKKISKPAYLRAPEIKQDDKLMIKALELKTTNIRKINESGKTLLHIAASKDCIESCNIMLGLGLSINAKDKDGRTPLHVAAINGA
ncbi:MAG: ankyrin repeat domain-containing protein, partial [Burkholderiales bacterium]